MESNGGDIDENALASSTAEAAAAGARQAVREAIEKARQDGPDKNQSGDAEAARDILVAGVLNLSRAQAAAASGAKRSLEDMSRNPHPANRFSFDFKKLEEAASSGASWGVKAAAMLTRQPVVDEEVAAAAAATGAWIMCNMSISTCITPARNASKYTALLGSLIGGFLPASVALYNLISGSSELVQLLSFGGMTLAVFLAVSGLIAGHFGSSPRSILYTKLAAGATVVIILTFFTAGSCSLLTSVHQKFACGITFGILILILVLCWIIFYFIAG